MKHGLGVFLNLGFEIEQGQHDSNSYVIANGIYVRFDKSVDKFYHEGLPFIARAILHNTEAIKHKYGTPITIVVSRADSNPAHYQVESFYPATIHLLKENVDSGIEVPGYYLDSNNRAFVWDNAKGE